MLVSRARNGRISLIFPGTVLEINNTSASDLARALRTLTDPYCSGCGNQFPEGQICNSCRVEQDIDRGWDENGDPLPDGSPALLRAKIDASITLNLNIGKK
jgi:hypothetical protein